MRLGFLAISFALAVIAATAASAADVVWSGANSGDWTDTGNWVGGSVPGSGDNAVFDGTGATTTITNASGTIDSIRVEASTPVAIDMTLSGSLTLSGGSSAQSIYLQDTNSLTVNSTSSNVLIISSHLNLNDGDLTVGDIQFGTGTSGNWIQVWQNDGDIDFGAVTVVETSNGTTGDSIEVNFGRDTGGTGTITLASLIVEGDTTDDVGSQDERNAGRARFEDCELTVTGSINLQDGSTAGGGDIGSGAEFQLRNSTLDLGANLNAGNGVSTSTDSGVNCEIGDTSSVTLAAGGIISANSNSHFFFETSTLTAGGAATFQSVPTCSDLICLSSTFTATTAGDLTLNIGGNGSGFLGVALIKCNFSNYDAAGLNLTANAALVALNECNFTGGQSGGSHITVNGLSTPSNPFPADLNQFDLSTGTSTTSWVNVLSATSLAFRVAAGQDFGFGSATVNATTAEAYDNDTATLGTDIVWGDIFDLVTAANGATQPTGLRADTTADQTLFMFDLTATTGNSRVTDVQLQLELEDEFGGFGLGDVASVRLFNDANSNQQYDSGESIGVVPTPASTTIAFTLNRVLNQGTTENWGIALTFGSSVAGKSGRASMYMLPTVGVVAVNSTVASQLSIVGNMPLLMGDSIPVAGVPDSIQLWEFPGKAFANVAFGDQPEAVIVDSNNVRVGYQNSGTVTPTIIAGTGGLIGSNAAGITVVAGRATFTNLGIDTAGTGFQLQFDVTGITGMSSTSVTSNTFDVAAPPSEIDVQRSSTSIPDGTGTDTVGNQSTLSNLVLTYTILNTGAGQLTLGAITFPTSTNCTPSVTMSPSSPVAPTSGSTNFEVTVASIGAGAFSFEISIVNNDPNEDPYNFTVSGTGIEPDIEVRFNAVAVADGGSHAVSGAVAGTAVVVNYTIVNTGTEDLTLTATPITAAVGSGSGNCTIGTITQPGTLVLTAGGGSTTFSVQVTPTVAGAFDFDVHVASNDPDENPYDVTGAGTAAAAPEPEIDVLRNSTSIPSGNTDTLGNVLMGANTDFTYTVDNSAGSASLVISGSVTATAQTGCAVSITQPALTTIPAGSSTTFVAGVTPSAASFSFTLTITSNDSDEGTYTIDVGGTGVATAPEIDVQRPAGTSIADGGTDNAGSLSSGSPTILTYTIENTGSAVLTLGGTAVATSNATGCTATVTLQPGTTVAAAATDTFEITVTPSGGAFSFDIIITNDDANEAPYNIAVTGNTGGGGSGGGGGGSDSKCSTSAGSGWTLLGVLALIGVALCVRRRREA